MKKGLLVASVLMAMAPSAMAAQPVEYTLDTMLVTATKYEERDLNIPAMTQVFTEKDIEELGVTNVMDLLANVPGAVITPPVGKSGATIISIISSIVMFLLAIYFLHRSITANGL